MHNYLSLVKQHVKDDYAVIIIDNSDITKPASKKMEELSEIRDGSTGGITQGYLTIDAAVLSEKGKMQEKKKLCHIITKVYLLRWRIEEYFRFKKQQFELEDLRVMSLSSIRNLNLFAMLAVGYISLTTAIHKDNIFLAELKECSKRIYEMPQFISYAIGYAMERVLSMSRCGISGFLTPKVRSQKITLFEYFKITDCGT